MGTGRFAAPLGIRLGIDPSRPMLQMAKARGIETVRGVAEALPFKGASLGSILVMTVLCYFDDPGLAFHEISRVLVPGGRVVVGFLGRGGEIAQRYMHTREKGIFLTHATFYTPEEVIRLMGEAGFSDIEQDTSSHAFLKGFHLINAQRDETSASPP